MTNAIIIIILIFIIGLAGGYVYRSKKKGKKCIGCPEADNCGKKQCSCSDDTKKH